MYSRFLNYLHDAAARQRLAIGLAKGAAARQSRTLDSTSPLSWEFSGCSQNGEDGILEVLLGNLLDSNREFLEIGAADGVQNNCVWLALTRGFEGVMVEGDPSLAAMMRRLLEDSCVGSRFVQRFVTRDNVGELLSLLSGMVPDVFSLDIDGNDFHVARALMDAGLHPKIVVLEYNSVFGPERSVTIPYRTDFSIAADPTRLYYGASLSAWRKLLGKRGYRFVTVERKGVNAFFVDPLHFRGDFVEALRGLAYAENRYQVNKHSVSGEAQFALIANHPLEEV